MKDFPAGFQYFENAIPAEREAALLTEIRTLPFRNFEFRGYTGLRRTVSFGWRYDFGDTRLLSAPPIPDFLLKTLAEVSASIQVPLRPMVHAQVTEYAPGAPIGWHRDRPVFDQVLGISLGSACNFRFRRRAGERWDRVSVTLNPRSAYVLDGPARWEWEHSIPPVEQERFSITFRNLQEKRKHE